MSNTDSNLTPVTLRLDHFLKLVVGLETGGQAKTQIQNGEVRVNGQIETKRRRKLVLGDVVEVGGKQFPFQEMLSDY